MQQLNPFFSQIDDQKAVRVALPMTDRPEKERINCIYEAVRPPSFRLLFPEGMLPASRIDLEQSAVVTVDLGGQTLSVAADITGISSTQSLEFKATEVISHEQLRSYFRVDAATPVSAGPLPGQTSLAGEEEWRLQGETIDLSGSGALCSFSQGLKKGKKVRIELALPTGQMELIQIIGHVVRCSRAGEETFHVGLHFDTLSSEDRDRIMASCFQLQRQHLRMKVQVKDIL
ncbi:flagellar brake protein [Desulfogranum mediterraneum]|uniref:flagellar brake protein n=1 Tax=Desulfogranum mediterraneum TaxID=160661 RepID=UPI0003FED097|nr:PilZ domain-containing protein [Desulfogranum mediterraneum]